MRTCPRCGNSQLRPEAVFCDLCATRLPASSAAPATATAVPRGAPPGKAPIATASPKPPSGPRTTWKELEPRSEIPDELNIEGVRWAKVDEFEPRSRESEVAHNWSINETRNVFQERGTKLYPDGREAACRGYLVKGGFVRVTLRNLVPGSPVAILRQTWAEGQEQGEIYIGEYTAGAFSHTDLDLQRPMRNRVHLVPRSLVAGTELTMEQEDLGSENGLYYFGMKIYQPGDAVDAQLSALARAAASARADLSGPDPAPVRVAAASSAMSWETIKKMGRCLPERIKVLGKEWELIDYMAFDDRQSTEDHTFAVYEAENYFTMKMKGSYQDGEIIEDSGIRWDSGHAEWTVGGTLQNRDLAIIVRVDVRELPGSVEVSCDDKSAGMMTVEGRDPINRWRNWSHIIPGRLVSENASRLRFSVVEGGAGMNMYRLWFYQAR